jgi:hypothetical protein
MEPDTVEAIACKEGLVLGSDLVLCDFKLACDNVGVIRSIREGSMNSYGHVVQEIRAGSHEFNFFDFVHEGRQSNVHVKIQLEVAFMLIMVDTFRLFASLMAFVLLMKINKGLLPGAEPGIRHRGQHK